MAYCRECGAYVPDGQSKCLACGFDEAEYENQKTTRGGSAYAHKAEKESPKIDTAEIREKIREEAKKWAEEESRRREEQKTEKKAADVSYKPPKQKSSTDTSKIFAALSYLSILFLLPYIFSPAEDGFARFHGKQGLILFIAGIVADIAGGILGLGWAVTLARLYLIYKGMMNALEGRAEPLPWIGELIK